MAIFAFQPNNTILNGTAVIKPTSGNVGNYMLNVPGRTIPLTSLSPPETAADGKFLGNEWFQGDLPGSPADTSGLAATNTAAIVTYAAVPYKAHAIYGVSFGYSGTPTNGSLKIEDGTGTIVYGPVPITSAGPGFMDWPKGLRGSINTALIITLTAGGTGVQGCVTAKDHRLE